MTTQLPEKLIVEPGAANIPAGMQLYGVVIGDIDDPKSWSGYSFRTASDPSKIVMCTALWRGYVSAYRLRSDGSLVLERIEYPYTDGAPPDGAHEELEGDFWLDLRQWFMGDAVLVPFVDGKVQRDEILWRRRPGIALRGNRRV